MDTNPSNQPLRNAYGDIEVRDNAHVLLGDQTVTNLHTFNIGAISLALRPRRRLTRPALAHPSSLPRSTTRSPRARRVLYQPKIGPPGKRKDGHEQRGDFEIQSCNSSSDYSITQYEHVKLLIACLYERLRNFPYVQRITAAPNVSAQGSEDLLIQSPCDTEDNDLVKSHNWQLSPAGRDLLFLSAATMSVLLGRNVSVQDVLDLLLRCQQDQLMPLLTFLLGFGLYRYLVMFSLPPTPSTQYFLTLEDAYGRPRPIAMDVCVNFSVLRQFLQAHYQQTNGAAGEALIRAGQFHLMLGSRRGRLIEAEEWSTPGQIKRGSRIVNSVFVSVNDTRCPRCSTMFSVTKNGEFHCETCQTYHRDYHTLSSLIDARVNPTETFQDEDSYGNSSSSTILTASRHVTSRMSESNVIDMELGADKEDEKRTDVAHYSTTGLKNVDIRILADRQLQKSDVSAIPLRWAQQVFRDLLSFPCLLSGSKIACYDHPPIVPFARHPMCYEVLRLGFQGGYDLYVDCQSTNDHLSMRLRFTDEEGCTIDWKSQLLSDLEIRQEKLSLILRQRSASRGIVKLWIRLQFPTMEVLMLFHSTFLALRSQDASASIPTSIHVRETLDEVCEFAGPIFANEVHYGLRLYRCSNAHQVRLEATVLGGVFDRTPCWTTVMKLPGPLPQWCRLVDNRRATLALNFFKDVKLYSFSASQKPPLNCDGALKFTFVEAGDAEAFVDVMDHLEAPISAQITNTKVEHVAAVDMGDNVEQSADRESLGIHDRDIYARWRPMWINL